MWVYELKIIIINDDQKVLVATQEFIFEILSEEQS